MTVPKHSVAPLYTSLDSTRNLWAPTLLALAPMDGRRGLCIREKRIRQIRRVTLISLGQVRYANFSLRFLRLSRAQGSDALAIVVLFWNSYTRRRPWWRLYDICEFGSSVYCWRGVYVFWEYPRDMYDCGAEQHGYADGLYFESGYPGRSDGL